MTQRSQSSRSLQKQQTFEERMAIVESVLSEVAHQASQKPTVESAVAFQTVGVNKVIKRLIEEITAARELRDHYKQQRDQAREELRVLKESLGRLSGAPPPAAPLPAAVTSPSPSPVPAQSPRNPQHYTSWSESDMKKAAAASNSSPEPSRSSSMRSSGASPGGVFLPPPRVVPVPLAAEEVDDDSATVYQNLRSGLAPARHSNANFDDDNDTVYGQFD
jgi:hypothetical protein